MTDYREYREATSAAGLRQCRACGSTAEAVAAIWLDEDLVLAQLPAQCEHQPAMFIVVTPSRVGEGVTR